MNMFEKKVFKINNILHLGLNYSKVYYILLVLFSIIIGFFTPLIISLQSFFIDYATDQTKLIFSILAPTIITYFVLNIFETKYVIIVEINLKKKL